MARFCPISADVADSRTSPGQFWPKSGRYRPKSLSNLSKVWPRFVRLLPISPKVGRAPAELGGKRAEFGRIQPMLADNWPELMQFRPTSPKCDQMRSKFRRDRADHIWPKIGQGRSKFGQTLAEIGPNWARFGLEHAISVEFVRELAALEHTSAIKFTTISPKRSPQNRNLSQMPAQLQGRRHRKPGRSISA